MESMDYLRILGGIAISLSIIGGPILYLIQREKHIRHFRVVDEGVLYRSAQPSPDGLARIVHDHKLGAVVSLRYGKNGKPPADAWEEEFCAKMGIRFYRIRVADENRALQGAEGRAVFEAGVEKFMEVMRDPKNHPVLVHCFRGVHRTGVQCAAYRMEFNGWSKEDAIEEMRARGYDIVDEHEDLLDFIQSYVPKGKK